MRRQQRRFDPFQRINFPDQTLGQVARLSIQNANVTDDFNLLKEVVCIENYAVKTKISLS